MLAFHPTMVSQHDAAPVLLAHVAAGDPKAMRMFLAQYGGLVWSIARRFEPGDAEDAVQEIFLDIWRSAASYDPARGSEATFVATITRASRPQGSARQLLAIAADGDRTPLLARIRAPTQVIHGVVDPLVPVANGRDLVQRIPGALGDFIEGMGHDLPQALLGRIAQGIATNAQRAS